MAKSSKTTFFLLLAGVLAVAAVLADAYFLFSIKTSLDSSSALEGELEVERRISSQLQASKEIVAATAEERGETKMFFVGGDEVVDFLESLEALGRNAGLELEVSSVGLAEEDEGGNRPYDILSVDITSEGSWAQNFRYLSVLENLPLKFQITRAVIEKRDDRGSLWRGSFALGAVKLK